MMKNNMYEAQRERKGVVEFRDDHESRLKLNIDKRNMLSEIKLGASEWSAGQVEFGITTFRGGGQHN